MYNWLISLLPPIVLDNLFGYNYKMRYITSTLSIVIYRVDITSETRGISIENIIEALISQLGPDKVSFFFTNSKIKSY